MKRKSQKGVKLGRRTVNKTQEIRESAKKMILQGRLPRPIEIVDELNARGIKTSSGQVCVALRGTEFALKEHIGPKPKLPSIQLDLKTAMKKVGLDDLEVAREYVRKVGDPEKASIALAVLKQLGN